LTAVARLHEENPLQGAHGGRNTPWRWEFETAWGRSFSEVWNRWPPSAFHLGSSRQARPPRRRVMSIASAWPRILDIFGKPLVIEPSAGNSTVTPGCSASARSMHASNECNFALRLVAGTGRSPRPLGVGCSTKEGKRVRLTRLALWQTPC